MSNLNRTQLYDAHVAAGATLVDFGGWEMPIQYPSGIVAEHLWTRSECSLFDVSHMGRLVIEGPDALPFLQYVLSSNAAALAVGRAQYCMIPNETGGAVDDAYLYRYEADKYLLVVNASNREKDLIHLRRALEKFDATITDATALCAAIAVQGPKSEEILKQLTGGSDVAGPKKNDLGIVELEGRKAWTARTGYTGDPIGFEVYVKSDDAIWLWNRLLQLGAKPAGLGARDTLRLEAALPLYGHEMGTDRDGAEIPIFAVPLARFAVSFAEEKGDFIGREALALQHAAFQRIREGDFSQLSPLPRRVVAIALADRGVMRAGMDVLRNGEVIGYITSGTMVPYYHTQGEGADTKLLPETSKRSIGLAYVASDVSVGDRLEVDVRGKHLAAAVVSLHMKGNTPPYAQPVIYS